MRKIAVVILIIMSSFYVFASDTVLFKDDCNRVVEIPKNIDKVVPSGSVASLILSSLAPEYMCSSSSGYTKEQITVIGPIVERLPKTGNLYGGKSTMNKEEILSTGAQVIIDIGTYREGLDKDLDQIQKQLDIPCIFLNSDFEKLSTTIRTLGTILLNKTDRADEIASFIDKTIDVAKNASRKIKEDEKLTVMICGNADGLGTNAQGSVNAQVLEIVGAKNAVKVKNVQNKNYGNVLNMETIYSIDPDVILFSDTNVVNNAQWKILTAVKNKKYYKIPTYPYDWLSSPPSLNMVLGVYWLGNLLYPQYYNYDLNNVIKEAYKILWNYEISQTELDTLLKSQY